MIIHTGIFIQEGDSQPYKQVPEHQDLQHMWGLSDL